MKAIDRCSLCPRLCRTACPVATGAAREAAVPAQIAGAVRAWQQGRLDEASVRDAITSCVDCGACQDLCHLHVPLPEALSELRRALGTAPSPPALVRPEEGAVLVAIGDGEEAIADDYVAAVGDFLGVAVGRWSVPASLGAGSLEHPGVEGHLAAVRNLVGRRRVVTAHRGVAEVLRAAGVSCELLWTLVGIDPPPSCGDEGLPIACCGGKEPFVDQHPGDARRMAAHWALREGPDKGLDVRCAHHLSRCGVAATSVVEAWLASREGSDVG